MVLWVDKRMIKLLILPIDSFPNFQNKILFSKNEFNYFVTLKYCGIVSWQEND